MATKLETILNENLLDGIVTVPVGTLESFKHEQNSSKHKIKYFEGAVNNLPDQASENATKDIIKLISKLKQKDLLIVLISGGGSSLLSLPKPPVSLDEKIELIQYLSKRGASIVELNSVRKRLSVVKGGGLAKLAYPATVLSLILSDIINDPLDSIASGPTVPNRDEPNAARNVLGKYYSDYVPDSIFQVITRNELDEELDFKHVTNFIIGNNKIATSEARNEAQKLGYESCVLSTCVQGYVFMISKAYTRLATAIIDVIFGISSKNELRSCLEEIQPILNISNETIAEMIAMNYNRDVCLVIGGEPTVQVTGSGKGGRNQQLALEFSIDMATVMSRYTPERVKHMNISLLCCGTDGIDGPTDAAGAIGFHRLVQCAHAQNIDPCLYLQQNDSYGFYSRFENGQYLIRTGHTGTNVMDIHLLIISRNKASL